MTYDLTIKDEDQHRDYHFSALARVRPEVGRPHTYTVEDVRIVLDKVVVKFGEQKVDVVPKTHVGEIERWIVRRYREEIEERIIELWCESRQEVA